MEPDRDPGRTSDAGTNRIVDMTKKRYAPPTSEDQAASIASIKQYLKMLETASAGLKSFHGLLLQHGRSFSITPMTFELPRMAIKQCYVNATRLAMDNDSLTYVEGIVCATIPIEHAWCTDSTGNVIDPTIRIRGKYGVDPGRITGYFGAPFKLAYLMETIYRKKTYGLLCWDNREILDLSKEEYLEVATISTTT